MTRGELGETMCSRSGFHLWQVSQLPFWRCRGQRRLRRRPVGLPRMLVRQWNCYLLLQQSPRKPANRQRGSSRRKNRHSFQMCVSTTVVKSHEVFLVVVHESLQPLCTADEASNPLAEDPEFIRQRWQQQETNSLQSDSIGPRGNFQTYQSGMVSEQTNRNKPPRIQKTTSGPCSANQSLTKYVSPNVSRFLELIATKASSLCLRYESMMYPKTQVAANTRLMLASPKQSTGPVQCVW